MKILLLLGSPHAEGTTATLAKSFTKGAEEAGHEVVSIRCSQKNVHPCIGCNKCKVHGICVWTDDMPSIEAEIRSSDAVVFVTPIYYFGITAQLKTVMDRFYSFDEFLRKKKPLFGLITASADVGIASSEGANQQYRNLLDYMGSESIGILNALGVTVPKDLDRTDYVEKAYQLGKSIRK